MSRDACAREGDVATAVGSATWTDELRAHVRDCATCREVELVTSAMMAAMREEAEEPLPDAGRLWWRAQLEARGAARRRSMRPLDVAEWVEPLVAVAVALLLLQLSGDRVVGVLARLLPGEATSDVVQLALPAPVLTALVAGMLLTGVMLFVGLGAAFARDR